ncbi:acyl-CoA N-acyltransferase [Lepidopterella palustris CBS 459.81]|uniref:Acyl-CoA N-acyltransferase n=1 Tax=Lepidopterella palustris CBS 459.81 TaxID=1314670 RepID=A0A8E2JEL2_9PEZI|nr:acyl-CoA N-acyltransferase [Lepidopterella palustris CBS 459.81]
MLLLHAQTARLELREFTIDDIANIYALESIPSVARYQKWPPRTWLEAEDVIREIVDDQKSIPREHFELAVWHGRTFIGRVGANVKDGQASLWYSFMPAWNGKGFATEAMKAFISLLGPVRLKIECDPRNTRSWRLAERLGFAKIRLTEKEFVCKGEWVGSLVYQKEPPPPPCLETIEEDEESS